LPQTTYVLAARLPRRIPDALFWDSDDPYHYIRRAGGRDPDLVLIGGSDSIDEPGDHDRSHLTELGQWVRQRFPDCKIERGWSGRIYATPDGLPYIGAMPGLPGVYEASGFAGCGMAYGAAAGMLLADLVLGRANPAAEVFDPARRDLPARDAHAELHVEAS
jgi:glycine/D-amino acid oxidase-like deaminating enzyme